jgi:hypothetical protein
MKKKTLSTLIAVVMVVTGITIFTTSADNDPPTAGPSGTIKLDYFVDGNTVIFTAKEDVDVGYAYSGLQITGSENNTGIAATAHNGFRVQSYSPENGLLRTNPTGSYVKGQILFSVTVYNNKSITVGELDGWWGNSGVEFPKTTIPVGSSSSSSPAVQAALITPESRELGRPRINDVLEILKFLAGIPSILSQN